MHLHHLEDVSHQGRSSREQARDLDGFIRDGHPDLAIIHTAVEGRLLRTVAEAVPTIFYAHGYGGVCASGGRLHLRTGHVCGLRGVPDPRCLAMAYLVRCNTRRPQRLWDTYSTAVEVNGAMREMAAVICGSAYVGDRLAESGVDRRRLAVLPYPVRPPEPADLPTGAAPATVLFAARLTPEKGGEFAVRALARLDQGRLLVSGSGGEQPKLERLVTQLGLQERVDFLGDEPPPRRLYGRVRLVVVPSIWPEPYGLVGPEAMSHGVPVVASRVGGIPEWLPDGEAGFLVEPKDAGGLAGAMGRLLEDAQLAARLGHQASKIAERSFSPEPYMARLQRLLDAVVGGGEPAAAASALDG
jgi:glycosyltransferase involved in cell wall biosynthesis